VAYRPRSPHAAAFQAAVLQFKAARVLREHHGMNAVAA
jgi:hypothetical protein